MNKAVKEVEEESGSYSKLIKNYQNKMKSTLFILKITDKKNIELKRLNLYIRGFWKFLRKYNIAAFSSIKLYPRKQPIKEQFKFYYQVDQYFDKDFLKYYEIFKEHGEDVFLQALSYDHGFVFNYFDEKEDVFDNYIIKKYDKSLINIIYQALRYEIGPKDLIRTLKSKYGRKTNSILKDFADYSNIIEKAYKLNKKASKNSAVAGKDYDIEETIDNPKVTDVIEISDSRESKEAEIQKIVDDIFGDVTTSNNDTVKEIKSTNMSDSDSDSIVSMSARNRNKAFIKKFIYPTQFLETGYDVEIGDLVTVKIADEKDTLTGTLVRVTKTDVDVQIYTEKGSVLHRIGYDGSEPRLKSLELVKDPKKFTGFEVGSVVAIKHVDFETYLYSVLRYVTDTVIFANVVRYFKEGDNIFTKTKLERFKRSDIIGIELLKQTIYPKSFVKLLGTTYGFKLQDTISQKLRELFKDDIEFQPGSPIDIYLKDIILHVNIVSNDGISITCKCYGEKTKIKIPYYLIEKIMEY